jgi:hypothetical protein
MSGGMSGGAETMNARLRDAVSGRPHADQRVAALAERLRRAYLGSDPGRAEAPRPAWPELRDALRRRANGADPPDRRETSADPA